MPLCAILLGLGLKEHDFRKCADTPFCGRHRAPSAADFQYVVDEASVSPVTADGKKISGLTATLRRPEPGFLPLSLTLNIVGEGTVRARLVEGSFEGDDPAVVAPEEAEQEWVQVLDQGCFKPWD